GTHRGCCAAGEVPRRPCDGVTAGPGSVFDGAWLLRAGSGSCGVSSLRDPRLTYADTPRYGCPREATPQHPPSRVSHTGRKRLTPLGKQILGAVGLSGLFDVAGADRARGHEFLRRSAATVRPDGDFATALCPRVAYRSLRRHHTVAGGFGPIRADRYETGTGDHDTGVLGIETDYIRYFGDWLLGAHTVI